MNEKGFELLDRCLIASELEPTRVIRVLKIVKRRVGAEKFKEMFVNYEKIGELADNLFPFLIFDDWKRAGYE